MIRNNFYPLRQKYQFIPIPDFPEEEKQKNVAKFKEKHTRAIEMLEEMRERIPWQRQFLNSIYIQIEQKGDLSPKQRSLITSLYLDNCVRSDADIKEQVELRKVCLRLLEIKLGRTRSFIQSVANFTNNRPFSPLQMKSIRGVAEKRERVLSEIPDFTDDNFDGWNFTGWEKCGQS